MATTTIPTATVSTTVIMPCRIWSNLEAAIVAAVDQFPEDLIPIVEQYAAPSLHEAVTAAVAESTTNRILMHRYVIYGDADTASRNLTVVYFYQLSESGHKSLCTAFTWRDVGWNITYTTGGRIIGMKLAQFIESLLDGNWDDRGHKLAILDHEKDAIAKWLKLPARYSL